MLIFEYALIQTEPIFTYVVLLEKAVKSWQILNNKLSKDPLVCLDPQQSGGEVGGRKEVFDQGTHHPHSILFLQKEQEAGNNLDANV